VPGEKWVEILRENGGPLKVPGRGTVGTENVYMLPEDRSRYHREPASVRTCYPLMCVTDENVLVTYEMGVPEPMPSALDVFPISWLYEPIVPPGPYGQLYVNDELIEGAELSVEDGTPFGWGDVLGKALGLQMKRTRVPAIQFFENHGATVEPDAWQPAEGEAGVLRVSGK